MKRTKEQRFEIQKTLERVQLPPYSEIPDVGLYLEQVTRYVNSFLTDFSDMQATPSMISNYVKLKIVDKPVKKAYSREQIARFLFIVLAKTVLSMDNIRKVFALQTESYEPDVAYEYFRTSLDGALRTFGEGKMETGGSDCNDSATQGANRRNLREEQYMMDCTASAIAHKMYLNLYFASLQVQEEGIEAIDV